MIKKIEQTIDKYHLLNNGDRVVIALSGGADSCALLLSLVNLAPTRHLKLMIAHFNHGLRGAESDEDEAFCRNLALKHDLVFETEKMCRQAIPRGMSPEDYFRRERYRFLENVACEHGANKIALGHHLEDQAETVLLNILRGSGLDGLKGFLPLRDNKFIRPLMEVTREEIREFLEETGTEYRNDSSNDSAIHLRNRIRGELIPFLREKYNPRIEENLARMAEIIRREDSFLGECIDEILTSPHIQKKKEGVSVSTEYFKTLHPALGFRLIKSLLECQAPAGKGFALVHIQSIVHLLTKGSSGKSISLPYDLRAEQVYGRLTIKSINAPKMQDYEYIMPIPGVIDLKERHIILSLRRGMMGEVDFGTRNCIYFDEDRIKAPLVLRNRQNGDWFEPLGTRGKQKIKKLFIDRKIPKAERESIALIADQESVIWIENMHLSERTKVVPETRNVLILEIRHSLEASDTAEENN